MFDKVFIDANIFLDISDEKRKYHFESFKILKFLLENDVKIFTSCDLITTIYYVLAKRDKRLALESIMEVNSIIKIIEFSNQEIEKTTNLMLRDKSFKDLEDTLQYILAKKENCDLIISNDNNFYSPDILVLSSKNFFEKFIKRSIN